MPLGYPHLITDLPLADVPMDGVEGWLLQGPNRQAVFFRLGAGTVVPQHSHGAQWGFVIEGELELAIDGETRTYRKGDTYSIAAGQLHSATCRLGALVLDVFQDPDRYHVKP